MPRDSNIKKKEYKKLEKYQGLKEELERTWKVKAKVVEVVIGALGAVAPKLEEWLQQIPRTTTELCPEVCSARNTSLVRCSGHVPPVEGPWEDPGLAGETMSLGWPGIASGSPRKSCMK